MGDRADGVPDPDRMGRDGAVSGESFDTGISGPRSYADQVASTTADLLEGATEDDYDGAPTIGEYLRSIGRHGLDAEHQQLIGKLRRMAKVYSAIQWHLAGDSSREQMMAELDEIEAICGNVAYLQVLPVTCGQQPGHDGDHGSALIAWRS